MTTKPPTCTPSASTPPGSFERYAHQASRTLLDLVEAAVHTGRLEQARRHAQAASTPACPGCSGWPSSRTAPWR
ncbi:hypothetical protein [Nonomuraea dietziae]|uniref:hypothetical protein n=1 Tax=Nonomuraea dietziae TaxID=65515 RepID=UPI0031DD00D8